MMRIFNQNGTKQGGFRIYPDQIAIALPEQQPFGPNTVTLLPIPQVKTNVPLRPLSDDDADENGVEFLPGSYLQVPQSLQATPSITWGDVIEFPPFSFPTVP
jgi:hypothetical protein